MKWDAAQTCAHSLLKCGECRHKEKEVSANGLARPWQDTPFEGEYLRLHGEIEKLRQQAAPTPVATVAAPASPLKLDLGCGTRKQPGFLGVDVRAFPGVDTVCDLSAVIWPWPDASVEEVFCSHALEHVPRERRPHFFNELYRVLKPGGKGTFITPHWASCRAYGDVTHEWPPISEFFWAYLDKQWRKDNAPHNDMYTCDFTAGYGYTLAGWLQGRNQEFVQEALTKYKEAAQDMSATVVARK